MKTLPLGGLPQTNDQLVSEYGDLLQSIFGYDVIMLRNCETAEKHGLFENNLLNKLLEAGILNIANYTPGKSGGIEVTFELTALGFVTKAMSIQKKILAGAAYYSRDEDQSILMDAPQAPIELDPPLAPSLASTEALTGKPSAPAATKETSLGQDFSRPPAATPDTSLASAGTLELRESQEIGTEDTAGMFAPQRQGVPSDFQPEAGESEGTRHGFLVEPEATVPAATSATAPALDIPLEDQVDNASGEAEGERFEIPRFLQRARDENRSEGGNA